jgi:glycerol-1-phosphatase
VNRGSGPAVYERYDGILVDLDGVVYRGDRPVPGAAEALREIRARGAPVLFITNNSARTPEQVVDKLSAVGVDATPEEILTSGEATAAMLRREGWSGRDAFVIGERGVRGALEAAGIRIVGGDVDRADLVVIGWDRNVDYGKLRSAALLIQRGARLVATNADATYPAPEGLWPGAGSILAAVTTATGAQPTVVGKPARPMFEAAAERTGASRPLVVGDRLDTDIRGAAEMGWDSLFVTTGAHGPADLPGAGVLPTYVAGGLPMLLESVPPARFRTAEPHDATALAGLLAASGLNPSGVEDRLARTVVSEDGAGRPVATGSVESWGPEGLLRSVAVSEQDRGAGLGLLAASAAIAVARSLNVERVWLFTETAAPFFARLGFEEIARSSLPAAVAASAQARDESCETAPVMVLRLETFAFAAKA